MTVLRIIALLCWLAVLVYMAPAVLSILRGKSRTSDPTRLAYFGFALISIGFLARWLIAPEAVEVWALLHVGSSGLALYTIKAARSYGRGPHV